MYVHIYDTVNTLKYNTHLGKVVISLQRVMTVNKVKKKIGEIIHTHYCGPLIISLKC